MARNHGIVVALLSLSISVPAHAQATGDAVTRGRPKYSAMGAALRTVERSNPSPSAQTRVRLCQIFSSPLLRTVCERNALGSERDLPLSP